MYMYTYKFLYIHIQIHMHIHIYTQVHDPDTGELQSLCRVMSGFTDAFYKAATERLGAKTVASAPSYYVTRESPTVWFDATEVLGVLM